MSNVRELIYLWFLVFTACWLPHTHADSNQPASVATGSQAELNILGRQIMVFRAAVGPYTPEQRQMAANGFVRELLETDTRFKVDSVLDGELTRIRINGKAVFSVTPGDVSTLEGETQAVLAESVVRRLEMVLGEASELRNKRNLATTVIKFLVVSVVWVGLVWFLARNRRRVDSVLLRVTASKAGEIKSRTLRMVGMQNLAPLLRSMTAVLFWALVGLTTFLWVEFVLRLFPHTRAFGEQLRDKFLGVLAGFGQSVLQALPGLGVVLIICLCARFVISAAKRYFNGIIQGRIQSMHFDATSAQITLRLSILIIWVAAIIIAFPYIPGSQSPAFRGIGVLSGLMLSLGASSIIGQWVNGLVLVYNRTCQIGDYVKVGEFEGTLMNIGFSTSRLVTARNEEIILPNSQLSSGSLINYTRQNETTGVIVPVTVTIGYNTPWRQVQAMLIEAARRTAKLKEQPAPAVFQTRLSDFYVEYQLRVVLQNPSERNLVLSALNANIQDVFNEFGVQIMSPHYIADPAHPAVVPKEKWHEPPAQPPSSGQS